MIHIDMTVQAGNWATAHDIEPLIAKAANTTITRLGLEQVDTELSVLLTDDDHIAQLNAQWRGKSKPTNVLSFPAMQIGAGQLPGPLLGDIVLAYETVANEATMAGKAFNNHVFHLAVHGILHLLGYDHIVENDANVMENLEKDILASQGISDPYLLPEQ